MPGDLRETTLWVMHELQNAGYWPDWSDMRHDIAAGTFTLSVAGKLDRTKAFLPEIKVDEWPDGVKAVYEPPRPVRFAIRTEQLNQFNGQGDGI